VHKTKGQSRETGNIPCTRRRDNPEKLATYRAQDEDNPEKLATYRAQDEDNPEKLATYRAQDEDK
jgi:hypothetical protein